MKGSPPVRLMNFSCGSVLRSSALISSCLFVGFFQMLHIWQRIGQRYVRMMLASVGRGTFVLAIYVVYLMFKSLKIKCLCALAIRMWAHRLWKGKSLLSDLPHIARRNVPFCGAKRAILNGNMRHFAKCPLTVKVTPHYFAIIVFSVVPFHRRIGNGLIVKISVVHRLDFLSEV